MTAEQTVRVMELLLEIYDPEEAVQWMRTEHPRLNFRRPTDCSFTEVWIAVDQLMSGAFT